MLQEEEEPRAEPASSDYWSFAFWIRFLACMAFALLVIAFAPTLIWLIRILAEGLFSDRGDPFAPHPLGG
jgi:hypothetical protein